MPVPSQNAYKPVALLFIGLCLFFATDAFVSNASLDGDPHALVKPAQRRTFMLCRERAPQ